MMMFPYDDCVNVLRGALAESLTEHAAEIRELNRIESFCAITYDILPWDPYLGVGFRIGNEPDDSFHSEDWKHGRLIGEWNSAAITAAQNYIHRAYESLLADSGEDDAGAKQEAAHLIFCAGAQALLDERIALQLQRLGIRAPVIGDKMPWHVFKYFVFDDDGAIKANYCDILSANRIVQRLLNRTIC